MNQPLHKIDSSDELLAYRDPGVAARAARVAQLEQMIERIRHDAGPQAKVSRDWLSAELKNVTDYVAVNKPYEAAREKARAAYAEAIEACTAAHARVAAAIGENDQDRAELALKKAQRAAGATAEALRAALEAHPEPGPALADLATAGLNVNAETRELAFNAAEKLAAYQYADRPTLDIRRAMQLGRLATLQDVRYYGVAEHPYKNDANARRLLNLRFAIACDALRLPCDRTKLELPQPVRGESEAR